MRRGRWLETRIARAVPSSASASCDLNLANVLGDADLDCHLGHQVLEAGTQHLGVRTETHTEIVVIGSVCYGFQVSKYCEPQAIEHGVLSVCCPSRADCDASCRTALACQSQCERPRTGGQHRRQTDCSVLSKLR